MSGDHYHKRTPPPAHLADDERHQHSALKSDGASRNRSRSRSPSRRHHRRSRSPEASRSRRHRGQRSRSRSRSRDRGRRHRERERDSRRRRDSRSRSRGRRSGSPSHSNHRRSHHNASRHTEAAPPSDRGDRSEHKRYDMNLENLPLPKQQQEPPQARDTIDAYYGLDSEEPIDKERIHREIEEKLRATLAKEGKVYPPPKVEASHPVFANDGSFLEIFKKMQQQQQQHPTTLVAGKPQAVAMPLAPAPVMMPTTSAATVAAVKPAPPMPLVGRRRGGKILKTGVVEKQKAPNDSAADPKDFWSLYLAEVKKYKSHACESEPGNRPLVK